MRILALAALLALIVDQVSKYTVVHGMGLARRHAIDVLPPLLNFRYGENRGINFGLLDGGSDLSRWALVAFSLIVVLAVGWWALRRPHRRLVLISAGFLIGGALGNVLDRLVYGYVLDFLNMSCCGIHNPFVFNIADVFIFAGAAGLVLLEERKPGAKARKGKAGGTGGKGKAGAAGGKAGNKAGAKAKAGASGGKGGNGAGRRLAPKADGMPSTPRKPRARSAPEPTPQDPPEESGTSQ